jgi:glycosyl transferase, family 25
MSWIRQTNRKRIFPVSSSPKSYSIPTVSITNCLDFIDCIFYINLEHRIDRKEHCLHEIRKLDPSLSKTHRIDAIYCKENGAIGCTQSHIKALQQFMNDPTKQTCLILEDDATFFSQDSNEIHNAISYLFHSISQFDVLLLGTGKTNYQYQSTSWKGIHQVLSSQTCSGYIVHRSYAPMLLQNFIESSSKMIQVGYKEEYCCDQFWKQLMRQGKWYALEQRILFQYQNYSDIEKKICDYQC